VGHVVKLSIIVVTYQRLALLQQCLDSVYTQHNLPLPYEIIVIDNGGNCRFTPPENSQIHIRLLQPGKNLGVAEGRNRGMQVAQGEYLVFIDDDATWHRPDDIAHLIQTLDAMATCGAVALKSLNPDTQQVIVEELPHPNKKYAQGLSDLTEVPYFYGAGHALRASVVQQVGHYPSRYFYAMEEIDLSLRLIDAGYQIVYNPAIAVYHYKSDLGRPFRGMEFWRRSTVNKSRVGWRLLPYPYPLTILFFWSLRSLIKTRNPVVLAYIWHDLWHERKLLRQERQPVKPETTRYLKKIGARLLY
jgi:GT2 family glycosyltransferase